MNDASRPGAAHGQRSSNVSAQRGCPKVLGDRPGSYLRGRWLSAELIQHAGLREEPIGDRAGRYGLPLEAAGCLGLFIPYRHRNGQSAFERLRLIEHADLDRFGGGKYRQPARRRLALYDPFGMLAADGPTDAVLLVEGELNALSVIDLGRGLPTVGLPGMHALTEELAEQLGHVPVVFAWLDRDENGYTAAAASISERLTAAGVVDVRFIDSAGVDANEALTQFGRESAARLVADLLDQAQPLPSPQATGPRWDGADTASLLEKLRAFVGQYVVLPGEHEAVALALWVLHSWAIEAAHATPYLVVVSPERRTGKTRLLEVLKLLVGRPWLTTSASEAALFRKIAQEKPTLLLDEIDAIFGSTTERTEPLRAILNSGNRRGASVTRCVGEGGNMVARDFSVFCPKVLAGIDTGRLPETIRDRAVLVRMQRRRAGEQVERLRERHADTQAEPIRQAAAAWAAAVSDALHDAEPDLPGELHDRAADAWEPLLAIADLAGAGWASAARAAALALSGADEPDEASYGTQILAAVRSVMGDRSAVSTAELLDAINADDELPFGGWRDGKGLDARTLARKLKAFGVRPGTIRVGDETPKGYRADDLRQPWERYLPLREAPQAPHTPPVTDRPAQEPRSHADVADVADVADLAGDGRRDEQPRLATRAEEALLDRARHLLGEPA